MTTFHKVISLGPSCETAYQIRQIVDQEEAYVFDWVIAAAPAVSRALRNGLCEIVGPEHLSLEGADGKSDHPFVRDALTGIEYHHDFRNDATFMDTLDDVQSKYAYLKRRTLGLLGSDSVVLFVHQLGTPDEAHLLASAVSETYPSLAFHLLEIAVGETTPQRTEGEILFGSIPGYGNTWQQRTPQWAELLDSILADSYGQTIKRRDPATRDKVE